MWRMFDMNKKIDMISSAKILRAKLMQVMVVEEWLWIIS